jgi:outer membrane lipoprotein SlyB
MDRKTLIMVIAASMLPAACAVPSHSGEPIAYSTDGVAHVEYGYVDRVELYTTANEAPVGVGTLLSGVASGVLGEPPGRRADVDAFGGAPNNTAIGNEIGQASQVDNTRYRIVVRLDSGVMMTVEDRRTTDLRAGDRVRVENNRVSRV